MQSNGNGNAMMKMMMICDVRLLMNLLFLFSARLDGVKTYMRMRRVPSYLQVKVIKWFDYLWLTQKCSDEERAVGCLPGKFYIYFMWYY